MADKPPVAPASLDQLEHASWVGWDGSESGKEVCTTCTFPNMPTQANTIPAHPGASPNVPARSCTTVEPPSPTRKPLYERLHRWIRSSFAFRGGRGRLGRVAEALKSNDLCTGAEIAEETGVSRKTGRQRESPTGWR